MSNIKYGLVLSGGGVRGLAHVGAIKALEEHGISPEYISGASAGAIVGTFYAAGYTCEEMLDFFHHTSIFKINKYAFRKPGILDTEKFYNILKEYFPEDQFDVLTRKLFISATDMLTGRNKIFHEGSLISATLASAAFPVVLSPLKIGETFYADGGITNNFPTEPLLEHCDKIIGVYANPLKTITANELSSTLSMMDRAFKIGMVTMSLPKFSDCHLLISPEKLAQLGTFSMNHLDEAYQIGYEAAMEKLNEMKNLEASFGI